MGGPWEMLRVPGSSMTALRCLGHFCFVRPGVSRPADQKGFRSRPGSGESVEGDLLALDRCDRHLGSDQKAGAPSLSRRWRFPLCQSGDKGIFLAAGYPSHGLGNLSPAPLPFWGAVFFRSFSMVLRLRLLLSASKKAAMR